MDIRLTSIGLPLVGWVAGATEEVSALEDLRVNAWKYIRMTEPHAEIAIVTATTLHFEERPFTSHACDHQAAEEMCSAAEHDECGLFGPCGPRSEENPYHEPVREDLVCSTCGPCSPSLETPTEATTSEPTKREAMLQKLVVLRLVYSYVPPKTQPREPLQAAVASDVFVSWSWRAKS